MAIPAGTVVTIQNMDLSDAGDLTIIFNIQIPTPGVRSMAISATVSSANLAGLTPKQAVDTAWNSISALVGNKLFWKNPSFIGRVYQQF